MPLSGVIADDGLLGIGRAIIVAVDIGFPPSAITAPLTRYGGIPTAALISGLPAGSTSHTTSNPSIS